MPASSFAIGATRTGGPRCGWPGAADPEAALASPRVFLPPDRVGGATALVDGAAGRHLTRVLRAAVGDAVVVFDGLGTEIDARILRIGARELELALGARRKAPATPRREITLFQGLTKGDRMDWIVQKTTELGIAAVVPVLAGRSVARPPAGGAASRLQRWQTIAQEAARQCGRADLPRIAAPMALEAALSTGEPGALRLVLVERGAGRPLRAALERAGAPIALLVGPEGGWTADETRAAEAAGFITAGLGSRILRAETAAIVAVALAQAAIGGLDD